MSDDLNSDTSLNIGRPSTFTVELGDRICIELATGKSLRKICAADQMPHLSTVMLWVAKGNRGDERYRLFSEQYACAREAQIEIFNDELVDIADEGNTFETTGGDGVTFDNVQRAKLRIDTRKWAMSKILPKKYGDKVDLNHGGQKDNPVEANLIVTFVKPSA